MRLTRSTMQPTHSECSQHITAFTSFLTNFKIFKVFSAFLWVKNIFLKSANRKYFYDFKPSLRHFPSVTIVDTIVSIRQLGCFDMKGREQNLLNA